MDKTKYILFETPFGKSIIIFGSELQHKDVAEGLDWWKPLSAGFIIIGGREAVCYGESISLKIKSNPEEDNMYANNALGFRDW
jgi:hypothetical protein